MNSYNGNSATLLGVEGSRYEDDDDDDDNDRKEACKRDAKDFADLLLTDTFYEKRKYHYWGKLFEFVHGETVETVAQTWGSMSDFISRLVRESEEEDEE